MRPTGLLGSTMPFPGKAAGGFPGQGGAFPGGGAPSLPRPPIAFPGQANGGVFPGQANGGVFPGGGMGQPAMGQPPPGAMGPAPQGNAYGQQFKQQWGMPFGQAQQGFQGDRMGGLMQMLQNPQFMAYLRSLTP